jgi:Tub family
MQHIFNEISEKAEVFECPVESHLDISHDCCHDQQKENMLASKFMKARSSDDDIMISSSVVSDRLHGSGEKSSVDNVSNVCLSSKTLVEVPVGPCFSTLHSNPDDSVAPNQRSAAATSDDRPLISALERTPGLLSLPIDSLHCIASFLNPVEWCHGFGSMSKATSVLSREIVRRVRLHGFKCATEVVTAFKIGHLADAKELASLYVSAGVPVYAKCLGHTYHTLHWRIQVEERELQKQMNSQMRDSTSSDDNTTPTRIIDVFNSGRTEFRNREDSIKELTYLEEKCLFWFEKFGPSDISGSPNQRRALKYSPRVNERRIESLNSSAVELSDSTPISSIEAVLPVKIPLPIHQHLIHQFKMGNKTVNEDERKMITPIVSLSADFFHPAACRVTSRQPSSQIHSSCMDVVGSSNSTIEHLPIHNIGREILPFPSIENNGAIDGPSHEFSGRNSLFGDRPQLLEDLGPMHDATSTSLLRNDFRNVVIHDSNENARFKTQLQVLPSERLRSALDSVEIEPYSSTINPVLSLSHRIRSDSSSHHELMLHLRSRFSTYQRRLEVILSHGGSQMSGNFDECLLDFWDEFFPHTTDIHYHDTETVVPRISRLHKFLTKPCPQALGVVQCEIERVRTSSRGKGVNMTGRFFPTYEYRLYIRNRPASFFSENSSESSNDTIYKSSDEDVRRDSVLIVAKNRGRKYSEPSGVGSASRKGSNNYYLYMPEQMDVDDHFNLVNTSSNQNDRAAARLQPNGLSSDPVLTSHDAGNVLLGRLQSNFVGTEFQIFTPHCQKVSRRPLYRQGDHGSQRHLPSFKDELDYDSGVSSDTNCNYAAHRKSRFSRLARRRNQHTPPNPVTNADLPSNCVLSDSSSPYATDRPGARLSLRRTFSSPDLSHRQPRTNRRAIANSSDAKSICSSSLMLCEEESGVITYTANLLGSRPRIMDVCVPKVTSNCLLGLDWKTYLATCQEQRTESLDNCRMLSCFRQLQQRRESLEQHNVGAGEVFGEDTVHNDVLDTPHRSTEPDGTSNAPDDFGLMLLQNRPPWWNMELGSFVLNFGGRVSVASVKNFQLCERTDQDRIMLQFGRIQGRHSFTMDFQHPLTAVQAFSIAISSLQSKISFG